MDEPWYAARCLFIDRQPMDGSPSPVYEERIVLFQARSFEEAMKLAEDEARAYASQSAGREYLEYVDIFHLFETEVGHGTEVFSLLRKSPLSPAEYVKSHFDTGEEYCSGT